jgi:hypothetical protein
LAAALKGQQQPGGAAGRHSRRSSCISVTSMSTSSNPAETVPPAAPNHSREPVPGAPTPCKHNPCNHNPCTPLLP